VVPEHQRQVAVDARHNRSKILVPTCLSIRKLGIMPAMCSNRNVQSTGILLVLVVFYYLVVPTRICRKISLVAPNMKMY